MDDFNQQLSLVVLNSEQLDGSQQVQYRFDEMGGTLGASEQDDWQLRDRLGAVMPAHARIELNDGRFCLCDLSGQTYINGATSPIGRARKVHLEQGDELVVGPFQGLPACVRIPLHKGGCGAAASSRQTPRIEDVDAFPGHIAGDSASRSELVVPLLHGDTLVGVFDLDSPELARFDADDQAWLEYIAAVFVEAMG